MIYADIIVKDKMTIFDIDGPHHFVTEDNVRTGRDILDKDLKRLLGYKVIIINYQEWQWHTEMQKRAIIYSKLKDF